MRHGDDDSKLSSGLRPDCHIACLISICSYLAGSVRDLISAPSLALPVPAQQLAGDGQSTPGLPAVAVTQFWPSAVGLQARMQALEGCPGSGPRGDRTAEHACAHEGQGRGPASQ